MRTGSAASKVHRSIGPREIGGMVFAGDAAERTRELVALLPHLSSLGISMDRRDVVQMQAALAVAFGMDNLQPTVTTPSIATPIQFLQTWLPGFVEIITAQRAIDDLVGMSTVGAWDDEEVVQGILEQLGTAVPYGDTTNIPKASWNANWERRTVVRFEEGFSVGRLEEARAARAQINTAEQKRESAALALEIQRNAVGFNGFNNGLGLTFGFLNDPGLPAASAFPNGAGGSPLWSTKTFAEITKDIRLMVAALRQQALGQIDPAKTPMTLGLPTNVVDYLSVTGADGGNGISVQDWLNKAYPKIRVESAPELENAIASSNEAYLYAESVNDTSTDDKRTFMQIVPAKFRLIGVEQRAKGYVEDSSNATAGVLLKRPFAVVRRYGC